MPTEKEIIKAADAAVASLTDTTYRPSMEALGALCLSELTKPQIVEAMPRLFSFIVKGMAAQQAADALLAEVNTMKQKS